MYMFDMLDLFISSHLYILMVVCTCLLLYSHPYILISLGAYALTRSLHPHILSLVCACLYPHVLTSSYPVLRLMYSVCLLVTSDPHILILRFMYSGYLLVSSLSHTLRFMYSRCLLISLHPHILISQY